MQRIQPNILNKTTSRARIRAPEKKVLILAHEKNPDGTYIKYNPEKHGDKATREISNPAFRQNKHACKLIPVLASEFNPDGTYIRHILGLASHANKKIKYISRTEFLHNNAQIKILSNEVNPDGSYIRYEKNEDAGEATRKISMAGYRSKQQSAAAPTPAPVANSGTQAPSNPRKRPAEASAPEATFVPRKISLNPKLFSTLLTPEKQHLFFKTVTKKQKPDKDSAPTPKN